MCEESVATAVAAAPSLAGALRVVLLCHQGLDASDRLLLLLRLCCFLLSLVCSSLQEEPPHQVNSSAGLVRGSDPLVIELPAQRDQDNCHSFSTHVTSSDDAFYPCLLSVIIIPPGQMVFSDAPYAHLPLLDYTRISHMPLLQKRIYVRLVRLVHI